MKDPGGFSSWRDEERGGGEALRDPCQAQAAGARAVRLSPGSAQRRPFLRADTRVGRLRVPGLPHAVKAVCATGRGPARLCFCPWECLCVRFGVSGCVCVGRVSVLPGTSVRVSFPCGRRARVSA